MWQKNPAPKKSGEDSGSYKAVKERPVPRMHRSRSQLKAVSGTSQARKIDVPDYNYNVEAAPVHNAYPGMGFSGD